MDGWTSDLTCISNYYKQFSSDWMQPAI